jgi:hypothetical protein
MEAETLEQFAARMVATRTGVFDKREADAIAAEMNRLTTG